MVRHKKHFVMGVVLSLGFLIVLKIIFSPYFGGGNALQAADKLFNSISKGSAYYIKEVEKQIAPFKGIQISVKVKLATEQLAENTATLLLARNVSVERVKDQLNVTGDIGLLLGYALEDADAMYYNRGEALTSRYGISEREAMYAWWNFLKAVQKALMEQKQFGEAKVIQNVIVKAVEVGYNFYGIVPESIGKKAGIVGFALVFYVIYTLWWGYAIFFLFEGLGLEMKAGHKKEA